MESIWHLFNKNFSRNESGSTHLNILYQEKNVFVMDNHLAAGWCWLNYLSKEKEYNFCHIDQHDDLANDNHDLFIKLFSKNKKVSITDYTSLTANKTPNIHYSPIKIIRWDNYILHTKAICPNWFSKEIYVCHNFVSGERSSLANKQLYQDSFDFDCGNEKIPIHPDNLNCYDLIGNLEGTLNNNDEKDWILNIDIDYFFKNDKQIFSSEYINSVCTQINQAKNKIAVITIALSPECCGGWGNSIRIYNQLAENLSISMKI